MQEQFPSNVIRQTIEKYTIFSIYTARAKKRVSELERMLEIAKKNYTQLGGRLAEDKKRMQHIRDKDK